MRPTILKNNSLLALAAIFLLSACTNLQTAIDRGNYDLAVATAAKKLRKKTKKKAKYVAALEEAFDKANAEDMARIERLEKRNNANAWEKVFHLALDIEHRQHLISPLLPVIDEEGYQANFRFVKTDIILARSGKKASELIYNEAKNYMVLARKGDKRSAQIAYNKLDRIKQFDTNYKDMIQLSHEAHELGIVNIVYTVTNRAHAFIPNRVRRQMLDVNVAAMNTFWERYHVGNIGIAPDYEMELNVYNIEMGPELINEKEYQEKKQITNGYTVVKDKNGNAKLDSLGKEIRVPNTKWIMADVLRTTQRRDACLHARMIVRDLRTNSIVANRNFSGRTSFENCFIEFRGDRRALSPTSLKHLNNRPLPFPSDGKMLLDASCQIMPAVKSSIRNTNLG